MCALTEKLYKKGEARGKAKGILSTVRNMMKNLNLTAEKALGVCEVFG